MLAVWWFVRKSRSLPSKFVRPSPQAGRALHFCLDTKTKQKSQGKIIAYQPTGRPTPGYFAGPPRWGSRFGRSFVLQNGGSGSGVRSPRFGVHRSREVQVLRFCSHAMQSFTLTPRQKPFIPHLQPGNAFSLFEDKDNEKR